MNHNYPDRIPKSHCATAHKGRYNMPGDDWMTEVMDTMFEGKQKEETFNNEF